MLNPARLLALETEQTLVTTTSELLNRLRNSIQHDSLAQTLVNTDVHNNAFRLQDSLIYHNGRMYVPSTLRSEIMELCHDHPLTGHPGFRKTLFLVTQKFWFPGLYKFVKEYVMSCTTCARVKPTNQHPQGILQPLPSPDGPWTHLTMDFIVKLPTSNGFDSVFVVVDRFTKMAHFIPCIESMNALTLARLFLDNIVRIHGLPLSIVSDRGSLFLSKFLKALLDS